MDGIIPLWKESGMTSHDCVFKLRKILGIKKIGHGGTLDPTVCGVLPICVGKGTKVIEYMLNSSKTYEGEITLGFSTTTEDATGEKIEETFLPQPISNQEIDQAMAAFKGVITQIPPMFSAVKVNGKRLYEYARNGEKVERPQRKAFIESFVRTSEPVYDEKKGIQSWDFKVVCGKGTYIRTLAVDTGRVLGAAAHMSMLTRTVSGGLQASQCFTLAQIREKVEANQAGTLLLPIEQALKQFQRIDLTEPQYHKVKNGCLLSMDELSLYQAPSELLALFYQNQVVSLYAMHPKKANMLKPSKVLRNN